MTNKVPVVEQDAAVFDLEKMEVEKLYKQFSGQQVLKGISTTFEKGKTSMIIGQSGSGKTVFLKCLLGLHIPDKGIISFDGRTTWKYWDGDSWETHAGLTTKTGWNTVAEAQKGLTDLTITTETFLDFAILLGTTDNTVTPSVDLITINYDEDGTYRLCYDDYLINFESDVQTIIKKITTGTHDSVKVNVLL